MKTKNRNTPMQRARYPVGYRGSALLQQNDGIYTRATGIVVTRQFTEKFGWLYGVYYIGENGREWAEQTLECDLELWESDAPVLVAV